MFDLVLPLLLCIATSGGDESLARAVTAIQAGLSLVEQQLLEPV